MGLRHLTRQIAADAGFHVVHVGRWRANFQHGYRRDALAFSIQEPVDHQYRFATVWLINLFWFSLLPSSSPSSSLPTSQLLHLSSNSVKRTHPGNQRRWFIFMAEQPSHHLHPAQRPLLPPRHSPPCHCRSSPIWGATFSRWHSAYGSVGPWAYSQRGPGTG